MPKDIKLNTENSRVLFLPHGGGPLPLLGDQHHQKLIEFLQNIPSHLGTPEAIVVISAHWETDVVYIGSNPEPALIYDYYGFPEQAYHIDYPVPGSPALAKQIHELLELEGITSKLDSQRGIDHGVFVPLKLMYPMANIPCVQLSLINSLDPEKHFTLGKALSSLRQKNILFIGSGFSFHNLKAFFSAKRGQIDRQNIEFEEWLTDTCTNPAISRSEQQERLINWQKAPGANYCHPREEHLLPLLVCAGLGQSAAKLVFSDIVFGKRASAFLW